MRPLCSAFEAEFMIQATPGGAHDARAHVDVRTVSTLTAAALTIADMVGIGVFTSLGFQVAAIPSAFAGKIFST